MDMIDKKILCELDSNCRRPISQIAASLRISRNVAEYRIRKLEKSIIQKYICGINLGHLGYNSYKVYLKTKNSSPKEFVDFIKCSENVIHLVKIEGIFDYNIAVIAEDIKSLDAFLSDMKNRFKEFIKDYSISMIVYSKVFKLEKLLLGKSKAIKFERYSEKLEDVVLDDEDRSILRTISQDANMPIIEISKKTGMTIDVIKYRLKNLRKNVINSFRIIIDTDELGYYHYTMMFKSSALTDIEEQKLFMWCHDNRNVIYLTKRIGEYDFEIHIAVRDIKELNNFTTDFKGYFGNMIESYQLLLNNGLLKLDYYPFHK